MEIKGSMGLPPSAPTGLMASYNGMLGKGSEMQLQNSHMVHTQPLQSDTSRVTSAPIVVTPLAASPLAYMPDMSKAIMSHMTVQSNMGGNPHVPFGGTDPVKKKRGRPRKYAPDGSVAITIKALPSPISSPMSPLQKRGRGRPPGSGKNQQLAALGELICGTIGTGFTPHAITMATGEDVAAKIMSFSQQGPRGICILSANGAISNVTLRQPSSSGGTVSYEGRFEILSLSGSFLVMDSGGTRSRTGGLSVSLAGPDGRVVGGGVAGMLKAASPVQVVVASFNCNTNPKKASKPSKVEGASKSSGSGTPKAGDSLSQELCVNEMAADRAKGASTPLNQSSGNGGSSDGESPHHHQQQQQQEHHHHHHQRQQQEHHPHHPGQMIAVHSAWPPASHGAPEGRRNIEIDMSSSPGQQ